MYMAINMKLEDYISLNEKDRIKAKLSMTKEDKIELFKEILDLRIAQKEDFCRANKIQFNQRNFLIDKCSDGFKNLLQLSNLNLEIKWAKQWLKEIEEGD